ncbi:MAG: ABC transporter permease [Pseudomonadota bacterium]
MSVPQPRQVGIISWLGIRALLRRALTRFMKESWNSIGGPIVSSLLFLAVFALAAGGRAEIVPGLGVLAFVAPGLVVVVMGMNAFTYAAMPLLEDKIEGIIMDLLAAPLSAFELVCGYALAATFCGLLVGTLVLALTGLFVDYAIHDLAALVGFGVLAALLFAVLGALVGLWADRWEHYSAAENFLILPLGFLSGAFFSLAELPELARQLIALNPIFYLIDGVRYGLTGHAEANLGAGVLYVGSLTLVLWVLLWRLFVRGYKIKA